METVRDKARALRERYWEKKVHLRGIIEFSNHCRQNCLYCGLRRDNQRLDRYRLDYKTIFACAQDVAALGFGTVVLQSGEDPALDVAGAAGFAALVERIKSELGLAVTLSLGERKPREYALLRKAGADRYLLKMEIMDAALYASLRPGKKLEDRRSAFFRLQDLGYESGTGLIVGLPGDAEASLEESLAELALWQPAMLSISPFTPQSETPLRAAPGCGANAALHAMALARIHMPRAHIPVTSALNLHGEAVRRAGL
ncbi:MAG: radical SAM protein, partial [Desulfovibrio sp.]|nr:radical SAM protein [Desulfovibrio sp.]